jgi:DNA-binding MarR family transcriptional regulator
VKVTKDSKRKRLLRVLITKKGEEVYQRSREFKVIHSTFSCLSPKKHNELRAYMERVRNRMLEELRVTPKLPYP